LAQELGIGDRVSQRPSPDDVAFDLTIGAVDVSVHLRWPTARETSGPWLRALSAGRATVITDLTHLAHVPALDPRTWTTYGADPRDPITVAVDILDEDHSLRLAMQRLASDGDLRSRLGAAAMTYWQREHTLDRMVADYERVLGLAAARPVVSTASPISDPFAHARTLMRDFPGITCE
jgi:hypothetical protein